jgi:hypothetical protein
MKRGMIGGLVAGAVFALFEMVTAAILGGGDSFFMPLRMIGAMLLGAQALDPGYSLLAAAAAGLLVHGVLAALFGASFGLAISFAPVVTRSNGSLVVAAAVFGFMLWVVNFYVIAPLAGWDWFPADTDPLVQVVAHTFFYGAVLVLGVNVYLDAESAR